MRAARELLLTPRSMDPAGVTSSSVSDGPGRIIDLPTMRSALHRRRRLWLGLAAAGLVLGAAMHVIIPPKYVAVTDLYLAEPSGEETTAMTNDANLLKTRLVAQQAIDAAHLPVAASTLLASYQGLAVSDAILSIKLSAKTPGEAVAWANAVAKGFLTVRSRQFESQAAATVSGLQQELTTVQGAMANLNKEINALGSNQSSAETDLITQQGQDQVQVSNLEQQIQQQEVTVSSLSKGSHVLDAAVIKPASKKKTMIKDGLSGLIAGLAIGLAIVLIGAVVSDRPRRRSDIAAALGAPVVLSVGRFRGQRFWRRWLQRPGPQLTSIQTRLQRELESVAGSTLVVAAADDPRIAAVAVALAAGAQAADGRRVVVIDAAAGRPLRSLLRLRGARGEIQAVSVGGSSIEAAIAPDDLAEMGQIAAPEDHDALLILATIDPAYGADHVSVWAGDAVVVVTAGEATATRIAATGQMLRQSGLAVRGALVLGADPDDDSLGSAAAAGEFEEGSASVGVWEAVRP